jgi:hypothetical protein
MTEERGILVQACNDAYWACKNAEKALREYDEAHPERLARANGTTEEELDSADEILAAYDERCKDGRL